MSIEYKSAIIYGCKVEQNLWHELWNYCDNHWEEEDDEIPEDWEDFFIETNQWGTASEYFFGIIVSEIDFTLGEEYYGRIYCPVCEEVILEE